MDSPLKEEKIEIKRGVLEKSSGEERLFKKWKQRYFVFCQIRRGSTAWLKLFYYKSSSSYKEGSVPLDFIDITTASDIAMVDRLINGHSHIISICTPGRTVHLSCSSCSEKFYWNLALRAYKYNDESRLNLPFQRAKTWNSYIPEARRSTSVFDQTYSPPAEPRRISDSVLDPFPGAYRSSQKLTNKLLLCDRCKDVYVPPDVHEWVKPEDSEIYAACNKSQSEITSTPSLNDALYEIPRFENDSTKIEYHQLSPGHQRLPTESEDNISLRKPLPLPPCNKPKENSISSSDSESLRSGSLTVRHNTIASNEGVQVSSDDECLAEKTGKTQHLRSPVKAIDDGYVSMARGQEFPAKNGRTSSSPPPMRSESLSKTSSVPLNLNLVPKNDSSYGFNGSTESLPSKYTKTTRIKSYCATNQKRRDNRYTPEPSAFEPNENQSYRRDRKIITSDKLPADSRTERSRQYGATGEQNQQIQTRLSRTSGRKYGTGDILFITDI